MCVQVVYVAIVYRSDWEALRIDDFDRPDPGSSGGRGRGRGEEGEGKYARDKAYSTTTDWNI